MTLTRTKSAARAALLALVLGGTAVAAAPAQAGNFNFGITFGSGQYSGQHYRCMNNWEIRADLRARGYRRIGFFDVRGRHNVGVRGVKNGWVWSAVADRCTGQYYNVRREYRIHQPGGGIHFHLEF